VDLAFTITSSGATLFTNFDDPLKLAASAFTAEEERKCASPIYYSLPNDIEMVRSAFDCGDDIVRKIGSSRFRILIVAFDPNILEELMKEAGDNNRPVEVIKERGDIEVQRRAQQAGRFVLGLADYVGGLEFDAVVLVGVDIGRVPPARAGATSGSVNFLSYAAHNKLYVAITRARYRVVILGTKERGPSRLLDSAFESKILGRGVL
jgi:hypothetical protein